MINKSKERINGLFLSAPYPGKQKFYGQPTGLLYALSVLADRKEREYGSREEVKKEIQVWCPDGVKDFDKSTFKRELTDYLKERRPKIVGVSTFTVSYKNALKIRRLVKRILPKTVVVFGGAHEDNFVKYYKKRVGIDSDFVISGDGPYILDELYRIIEENPDMDAEGIKNEVMIERKRFNQLKGAGLLIFSRINRPDYSTRLLIIPTQAYKESRKRTPLRLDELPIMPRYLLKDEDAISRRFSIFNGKRTAQVMVGQGCPYACGFCSEGIKKSWFDIDSPMSLINPARRIPYLERELEELKNRGYEAIFFDDSTFFAKPKWYMKEVISLLKKYDFEWGCQTTLKSIYTMRDLLGEMKESGMKYVYVGVEHFDSEIRDSFGKNIMGGDKFGTHSVEKTIELLKENDISVGVSLSFGHPDPESKEEATRETKTTARYTIDKMTELIKKYDNIEGVSLNLVTYHPGTPDSVRYEKKIGFINYTAHPNERKPFTSFEEGIGVHAKGVNKRLAGFILKYAKRRIKDKLWI